LGFRRSRRLRSRLSSGPLISRLACLAWLAGSCWSGDASCLIIHWSRGIDQSPLVRAHKICESWHDINLVVGHRFASRSRRL
jgi:hypothetical protein